MFGAVSPFSCGDMESVVSGRSITRWRMRQCLGEGFGRYISVNVFREHALQCGLEYGNASDRIF